MTTHGVKVGGWSPTGDVPRPTGPPPKPSDCRRASVSHITHLPLDIRITRGMLRTTQERSTTMNESGNTTDHVFAVKVYREDGGWFAEIKDGESVVTADIFGDTMAEAVMTAFHSAYEGNDDTLNSWKMANHGEHR